MTAAALLSSALRVQTTQVQVPDEAKTLSTANNGVGCREDDVNVGETHPARGPPPGSGHAPRRCVPEAAPHSPWDGTAHTPGRDRVPVHPGVPTGTSVFPAPRTTFLSRARWAQLSPGRTPMLPHTCRHLLLSLRLGDAEHWRDSGYPPQGHGFMVGGMGGTTWGSAPSRETCT